MIKVIDIPDNSVIYSLSFERFAKIHESFTPQFLNDVLASIPNFGKNTDKYWLFNNKLMLQNPHQQFHVDVFNTFLQMSQYKCNFVQILK